ncbi:3-octaprenyl-4-hydroxybenzoate carboxy-lyase [Geobacter sp. OR-1]|uniref:UbiD family decarboxylase n=1 Tax=Geobacter sp. OR-1 TaxID=1266765 RepID=UPI000542A855|nr:UbiD family decarboxylase [Geobacter sp. OR-1]GAM11204.1 3-octaprenyl-4-hydroxybenzoate carboxy-lyase [Geobacter sp. OR-1]
MAIRDLRDFLRRIEELGELHRVTVEVDPILEMAAISARVSKIDSGGPALLFSRVKGSGFGAAANLFGSKKRMAAALSLAKLGQLSEIIGRLIEGVPGRTAAEKLSSLSSGSSASRFRPQIQQNAPCQELRIEPPDLTLLPIPKCWPSDGEPAHEGRFLTLPLVITRDPADATQNCGMYRAAVLGPDRLAIHWSPESGGALHAEAWRLDGRPMPVAIALGGPPALAFAAMLPLPEGVDEFTFAGLLLGEPVAAVKCPASDLLVPAGAELVIEGFIEPGESAADGAFGNHTGYYNPSGFYPLVRVTAITHRREMILPFTVVGRPPMEDCMLAEAACRLLLPLLQQDLPAIRALHRPIAGTFHGATVLAVDKAAAGGRETLLQQIRGIKWLAEARLLVLVDEDQDPVDVGGVYWRMLNNTVWQDDLIIDGKRLTVDATRKPGDSRVALQGDPDTECLVTMRWQEYGFNDGR